MSIASQFKVLPNVTINVESKTDEEISYFVFTTYSTYARTNARTHYYVEGSV